MRFLCYRRVMEKGFEGLGIVDEEQGLFGQEDCPKRAKVTNAQDRIANEQARREEIAHMEQQLKELKRSYK